MQLGSIAEDDDARFQYLGFCQLQVLDVAVLPEKALTATNHNRIDLESVLVNEDT